MSLTIEVNEAKIVTPTISLKVIQVGNRQMTQSVFRQIEERRLVDLDEVKLLGEPWGWVNYDVPGKIPGRQFVAQFGDRIYRCPVRLDFDSAMVLQNVAGWTEWLGEQFGEIDWLGMHSLLSRVIAGQISKYEDSGWLLGNKSPFPFHCVRFGTRGRYHTDAPESQTVSHAITPHPWVRGNGVIPGDEAQQIAREMLRDLMEEHGYDRDEPAEFFFSEMYELAAKVRDYCRRWDALLERLAAVEQLFIAC